MRSSTCATARWRSSQTNPAGSFQKARCAAQNAKVAPQLVAQEQAQHLAGHLAQRLDICCLLLQIAPGLKAIGMLAPTSNGLVTRLLTGSGQQKARRGAAEHRCHIAFRLKERAIYSRQRVMVLRFGQPMRRTQTQINAQHRLHRFEFGDDGMRGEGLTRPGRCGEHGNASSPAQMRLVHGGFPH
jgi:hypothetical protein